MSNSYSSEVLFSEGRKNEIDESLFSYFEPAAVTMDILLTEILHDSLFSEWLRFVCRFLS